MSEPVAPITTEALERLDALAAHYSHDGLYPNEMGEFVKWWPAIRARIAELEKRADDAWVRAAIKTGIAELEETIAQQVQRIAELERDLRTAIETCHALSDQQAMPDEFWRTVIQPIEQRLVGKPATEVVGNLPSPKLREFS